MPFGVLDEVTVLEKLAGDHVSRMVSKRSTVL
jgi:hypothetical protein